MSTTIDARRGGHLTVCAGPDWTIGVEVWEADGSGGRVNLTQAEALDVARTLMLRCGNSVAATPAPKWDPKVPRVE